MEEAAEELKFESQCKSSMFTFLNYNVNLCNNGKSHSNFEHLQYLDDAEDDAKDGDDVN